MECTFFIAQDWKKKNLENHHFIFICRPLEHISGPLDVQQDVGEDPNSILVTPHHQVGKTNVVIGGNLALGHTRVHALEDSRRVEMRIHRRRDRLFSGIITTTQ